MAKAVLNQLIEFSSVIFIDWFSPVKQAFLKSYMTRVNQLTERLPNENESSNIRHKLITRWESRYAPWNWSIGRRNRERIHHRLPFPNEYFSPYFIHIIYSLTKSLQIINNVHRRVNRHHYLWFYRVHQQILKIHRAIQRLSTVLTCAPEKLSSGRWWCYIAFSLYL